MKSELGAQLRLARQKQQRSLRSVAAAVGVSPSLLSQVETGRTQPSVSTLYSIVNYLDLSLDDLLGTGGTTPAPADGAPSGSQLAPASPPSEPGSVVQRASENPVIEMENGVRWERLAVGAGGGVDPLITTYSPGGSSSVEGKFMRHSGMEYGYLLEGELTLKVEFDTWTVRAGDSICFDSSRPHLYVNESDRAARGIWFVVGRRELTYHAADQADVGVVRGTEQPQSAVDVLEALDAVVKNRR